MGLDGLHGADLGRDDDALSVTVESAPVVMAVPLQGGGQQPRQEDGDVGEHVLIRPTDPAALAQAHLGESGGRPVRSERSPSRNRHIGRRRCLLTARACRWAIQARREHACVQAAGTRDYPEARRMLVTADAGGSNSYRYRL